MEILFGNKEEMGPHYKPASGMDLRQAFSLYVENMPTNAFLVVGQELVH